MVAFSRSKDPCCKEVRIAFQTVIELAFVFCLQTEAENQRLISNHFSRLRENYAGIQGTLQANFRSYAMRKAFKKIGTKCKL